MAVRITERDNGYRALLARVFDLAKSKPVITMGVHAAEGDAAHDKGSAVTVLDVARWNEFGTDRVPERSFIRAWFDEAEQGLRRDLFTLAQSVVAGKRTPNQVLELLGLRSVAQIQARIAQGIAPANAPSTIERKGSSTPLVERKGSSTPLVNTGVLQSSITYKVEK